MGCFWRKELLLNVVMVQQFDFNKLCSDLKNLRLDITERHSITHKVSIKIHEDELSELVEKPYVFFVEPIDQPALPENYTGRTLHRSNVIASDFAGGLHYDGTGISIGMHDDGVIGPHIDYEGRIPTQYPNSNNGDHGDHVAGIIMGSR